MKQLDRFEYLDDKEVFSALMDGETVYAVVMWSRKWAEKIYDLREWNIKEINTLFKEGEQVIFLKEIKK